MKIIYENWRGPDELMTVKEAIDCATMPAAYSYNGELERIKAYNEKLREAFSRLVETIYDDEKQWVNPEERLEHILGYGFKVEKDA